MVAAESNRNPQVEPSLAKQLLSFGAAELGWGGKSLAAPLADHVSVQEYVADDGNRPVDVEAQALPCWLSQPIVQRLLGRRLDLRTWGYFELSVSPWGHVCCTCPGVTYIGGCASTLRL